MGKYTIIAKQIMEDSGKKEFHEIKQTMLLSGIVLLLGSIADIIKEQQAKG